MEWNQSTKCSVQWVRCNRSSSFISSPFLTLFCATFLISFKFRKEKGTERSWPSNGEGRCFNFRLNLVGKTPRGHLRGSSVSLWLWQALFFGWLCLGEKHHYHHISLLMLICPEGWFFGYGPTPINHYNAFCLGQVVAVKCCGHFNNVLIILILWIKWTMVVMDKSNFFKISAMKNT